MPRSPAATRDTVPAGSRAPGPARAGPGRVDERARRDRAVRGRPCAASLRQGEFRIFHKPFTLNDLSQVCQPRFPRSFPHLQRESSGPSRPVADDSGTTPDGLQPRLAKLEPAARAPLHPAGGVEGWRAVRPGRSHHGAARFPYRPGWRPQPPTGCTGIFVLDLDQPAGTSLSRLGRAEKPGKSRSNAWASGPHSSGTAAVGLFPNPQDGGEPARTRQTPRRTMSSGRHGGRWSPGLSPRPSGLRPPRSASPLVAEIAAERVEGAIGGVAAGTPRRRTVT